MSTDPHALIGVYATDALDDDERREVEAHLATCSDCRRELAGYREVLSSLATHVVAPPVELEDAVVAAARRSSRAAPSGGAVTAAFEAPGARGVPAGPEGEGAPAARASGSVAAFGGEADGPTARLRGRRSPSLLLAAAAAAAVVFVAGGVLGRATAPVVEPEASGRATVDAVLAVASAEDAAFLPADVMGADARVVISDEMGKIAFLAADLPTPAKGECYQVWRVAPDGTKTSAGVFTPDAEGLVAVVLDAGADTASFVITTEPPGGSPKPTGDMVGQVGA
jgi:anti-sigma-K factor RskA